MIMIMIIIIIIIIIIYFLLKSYLKGVYLKQCTLAPYYDFNAIV